MTVKNLPKTAVVTLYYNRADHVEKSIQSLISQTYRNLRIIIVDDASTDNTYEELKKMAALDERIELRRNETNKGFTQTLIDTIAMLDVEYIAIHGAGDISLPSRIEEQVSYLEKNPEVGVVAVDLMNLKRPKFNKIEILLGDLLKKNRITHGAVMYRKSIYQRVGGYRSFFTTRQDKDLWYRMVLITQIHHLNKKLYKLIEQVSSVSKSSSNNVLPTFLSIYARDLARERVKNGTDSLDLIGNQAGLLFNPSSANKLFFKLMLWDIYKRRFSNVKKYLRHLSNNNKVIIWVIIVCIFLLLLCNLIH